MHVSQPSASCNIQQTLTYDLASTSKLPAILALVCGNGERKDDW